MLISIFRNFVIYLSFQWNNNDFKMWEEFIVDQQHSFDNTQKLSNQNRNLNHTDALNMRQRSDLQRNLERDKNNKNNNE